MTTPMKIAFVVGYIAVAGTQAVMSEGIKAIALEAFNQKAE